MLASHGHFERLSHGLVEIADEHGFLCFLARQEYAPSGTMDRGGWQAQPLWSRQLGATRPGSRDWNEAFLLNDGFCCSIDI